MWLSTQITHNKINATFHKCDIPNRYIPYPYALFIIFILKFYISAARFNQKILHLDISSVKIFFSLCHLLAIWVYILLVLTFYVVYMFTLKENIPYYIIGIPQLRYIYSDKGGGELTSWTQTFYHRWYVHIGYRNKNWLILVSLNLDTQNLYLGDTDELYEAKISKNHRNWPYDAWHLKKSMHYLWLGNTFSKKHHINVYKWWNLLNLYF